MSNSSHDLSVEARGGVSASGVPIPEQRPALIPADVWATYQEELAEAEREETERSAIESIDSDSQEFVSAEYEIGLSAGEPVDTERAISALSKVDLFDALPRESLVFLVNGARQGQIAAESYLFVEGDPASSFFVVLDGTVEIIRHREDKEIPLRQIARNEPVGLFGLFSGQVRAACARAIKNALVLEVPCAALQQLIHADPALHDRMARFYRERLVEGFVGASRLFAELEPSARARLIERFKERMLEPGETLLHPGEVCNLLAVVLNGRILVEQKPRAGQEPRLFEVYPGQFICVTGAFAGVPARTRLLAPEPTVVALLGHREIAEVTKDFPAVRGLPGRLPGLANALDREVFCGHTGVPGL